MNDIFDNSILCRNCNTPMQKVKIAKSGFLLRAVVCQKCGSKIIHPADEQEFSRFANLRNKEFHVKMRLVGNSYAVSIPKEIVSFIREQEKIMDDMVKLCFEDFGRLSLNFGKLNEEVRKETIPNLNAVKLNEIKKQKQNDR
ncbi:MAG: hypothetical protein NTW17_02210 [Candidatus Pacearchaeota archaeon]|nr:hypothetical protein [Candidatus Pacearchaeota archaeon]